jgi:hypothetical protein
MEAVLHRLAFGPFAFGPSVARLAINIFTVANAVRESHGEGARADVPATRDAVGVHLPFQEAAVGVLDRLSHLSNTRMPPPLRGALWCWPAMYRSARELPDLAESLQQTFVTAATVGPSALLDPMLAVFEAIGKSAMAFAHRGQARKSAFDEHCEQAYGELATYGAALRERLAGAVG